MANVNVSVKAALKYYDGTAAKSVAVKAVRQADPTLAATIASADIIEATSDSSTGIVELTLVGSDAIPVTYKIQLPDQQYFYLKLPKNAKATNLGIITVSANPSIGVKNISDQIVPMFIGADLASAAALVPTCNVHTVTGTTTVTSITAAEYPVGQPLTLIFSGALTFTDGSNLKLAGNLVTTADDTITLISDGTNFYEVGRAVN